MSLFYEIIFENGKTLKYKVEDNPVAEIWVRVTKEILARPDCHVFENQWSHGFYDETKVNIVWNRMLKHIDKWNQLDYSEGRKLSMPLEYDKNEDYRDLLNRLHETFHRFEEEMSENNLMMESYDANPLAQLNVDIHTLESCIFNKNMITVTAGFFLHSNQKPRLLPIKIDDPSLYKYWTNQSHGGLYLGYHTIGKSLESCWNSNDVELVQQGMVRPQLDISNEVILHFDCRPADEHIYAQIHTKNKMQAWIEKNRLEKYVDLSDPKHTPGYALLGKLVNEMTAPEADDFFWDNKVVTSRFVEE